MKRLLLLLVSMTLFTYISKGQLNTTSQKVIFYNYNEFNSRMSIIFSSDTIDVTLSKVADSIYSYNSKGYFSIKLQVDRKLKKATYENNFYDSEYEPEDENSRKEVRKAFQVKYVDNKIFEYNDQKYFVYRILVKNVKKEESEELLFWCKEFGIIMQKSLIYPSLIRYEFLNSPEKNNMIHHLSFFVFSDLDFYYLKDWEKLSSN
jgi:hypothetical protein